MQRKLNFGLFSVCADDGGQTVREGDAKKSKQFRRFSVCDHRAYYMASFPCVAHPKLISELYPNSKC